MKVHACHLEGFRGLHPLVVDLGALISSYGEFKNYSIQMKIIGGLVRCQIMSSICHAAVFSGSSLTVGSWLVLVIVHSIFESLSSANLRCGSQTGAMVGCLDFL